jgi:alanine dehydrogenase
MKIGILREEKKPQDTRVPLTPSQCRAIMERFNDIEIVVQPCSYRCFTNEEYRYQGVILQEDLSDCDMLFGVKEIPASKLLPQKTYFIFSHTIKKQAHNQKLLQEIIRQKITLIDYECMVDDLGKRIIAFGRWAGIVGAYHAIRMIGFKTHKFRIRQMADCLNFAEAQKEFEKINLPPWKIVLTGTGRVSEGAAFLLDIMGVKKVLPYDFCYKIFDEAVCTQLSSKDMYFKNGADKFDRSDFHQHPEKYQSAFYPFTKVADVMINGIYWNKNIPVFFKEEQIKERDFNIKIIADISCDLVPESSIPTTIFASSIADPYFGYDRQKSKLCKTFTEDSLDIMAIDNLPNELPRDASEDFGNQIISYVIPELIKPQSRVINDATIAKDGMLTEKFSYLEDYIQAE